MSFVDDNRDINAQTVCQTCSSQKNIERTEGPHFNNSDQILILLFCKTAHKDS
jgi:hypothetical protein